MNAALSGPEDDLLAGWMAGRQCRAKATTTHRRSDTAAGGLRFAFYGRVSTEDYQDRASLCRWQREAAGDLVAGRGPIVAEFFDVGHSRRRAWDARPQASYPASRDRRPQQGIRRDRSWGIRTS